MPNDRRRNVLSSVRYIPCEREIRLMRAHRVFDLWLSGRKPADIAVREGIAKSAVHVILANHIREMRLARIRWKHAELRCYALAMELRLLRLGKETPPDQPIESLKPPKRWLKVFLDSRIETVNQLRAVDEQMLFPNFRFPKEAIDWAIMKLDQMGLSHVLRKPLRKPPPIWKKSLVPRRRHKRK